MSKADPPMLFRYPPVDRRMLKLGCYLTSIGELRYKPRMKYPVAGHPEPYAFDWKQGRELTDYAIVLITEGSGQFESVKVPASTVKAGDLIYVIPGEWHRYRPLPATGWTEKWLCLNGRYLHQLQRDKIVPNQSALLSLAKPDGFESLLDGLFHEVCNAPNTNRLSWSCRALELLFHAVENTPATGGAQAEAVSETTDPLIARALRFIRENCHRPINVQAVSRHCNALRRTMERRFEERHRHTIAQEIVHCRIERAEMMLKDSTLPVKQVAYACGFESAQRMIYNFRRRRGGTPGQIRERKS